MSLKLTKVLYDEFLRPIESDFAPLKPAEQNEDSALQLIVDENLVNGAIGQFLKVEKMYSIRDFLGMDPRAAVFKQLLTTTTIGMVMPAFKEDYGEGKPIDIVGTASHDFIDSGLGGDITPSGFSLEKNGNFQFGINLGAQVIVQGKDGEWQEARAIYVTLQLRGKMFIADDQFENRTFVILPKGVQMPTIKVFKEGQEQFLEQMLIQSMVGYQLDNIKKAFKPVIIPLKKFDNPPELECFGFNLTNLDFKINKGYL